MAIWRKQTIQYFKNGKRSTKATTGAKPKTIFSKRFYGTLRLSSGKRKQIPLTEDEKTSETLLNRLQMDEDRKNALGITPEDEKRLQPINDVLNDYEKHLRSKGNTVAHIVQQILRINELVKATKAKTLDELETSKIERTLSVWRDRGRPDKRTNRKPKPLSVASSNHYARAIKSFSRWLWLEKRMNEDVLRNLRLLNAKAFRTRERRALKNDELSRLITTTEASRKMLCGIRSRDRAILYAVACYTGLRASELASLHVRSFDIDNATVTVDAAYSKRRRKDIIPLHPTLLERLKRWLPTKTGKVWPSTWAKRYGASGMLKSDLKRANIKYVDDNGRVLDFHSLRHTFITSLARSGVHPLKAKELARHSTITLTMDVYSHTETDELRSAIESLPDIR